MSDVKQKLITLLSSGDPAIRQQGHELYLSLDPRPDLYPWGIGIIESGSPVIVLNLRTGLPRHVAADTVVLTQLVPVEMDGKVVGHQHVARVGGQFYQLTAAPKTTASSDFTFGENDRCKITFTRYPLMGTAQVPTI